MLRPIVGIAAMTMLWAAAVPGPASAKERGATVSTGPVASTSTTIAATDISAARRVYHRRGHYVAQPVAPRYDYGVPAHHYWGPPYASLWPLPPIWPFGPWPFYY